MTRTHKRISASIDEHQTNSNRMQSIHTIHWQFSACSIHQFNFLGSLLPLVLITTMNEKRELENWHHPSLAVRHFPLSHQTFASCSRKTSPDCVSVSTFCSEPFTETDCLLRQVQVDIEFGCLDNVRIFFFNSFLNHSWVLHDLYVIGSVSPGIDASRRRHSSLVIM